MTHCVLKAFCFKVFQCGEVLQNTTGAFGYKSLPTDNKALFLNCTWVIAAESNQLIDITLTYLNLPKKNSCAHGSIQVS